MRTCAARLPHGRWAAARCSLQQAAAGRRSRCWSGGRTALFYRSCCLALPYRPKRRWTPQAAASRRFFLPAGIPCGLCLLLTAVSRYTLPALTVPLLVVTAVFAALLVGAYNGWRKEGIWLQNGRLTLRWQHGFHLHDICVLCPVPALTALQSPWAAAVHRTNLTLTFPGGVKCKVRSVSAANCLFYFSETVRSLFL